MLEFEKPVIELETKIKELKELSKSRPEILEEIERLEKKLIKVKENVYKNLSPWNITQIARHPDRPHSLDFIKNIFDDYFEIHGDRSFGNDYAIVAGFAKLGKNKIVFVGEEKGRDTKEKIKRNFGMPHPEGYRKAIRAFSLAEKFNFPVVTFVDTPGAYPGIGAEERGQAWAISFSIYKMIDLNVPILTFIIGEGGSGGALAIAVGDKVYALKYSIYSVISPEGCAAILFRDSSKAEKAAKYLKLTSSDLLEFSIIDGIIEEPLGGSHIDPQFVYKNVKDTILRDLEELGNYPISELKEKRIKKYLKIKFLKEGENGTRGDT
ncbi:MAG: acetyl-CoA carboxylase carboxyltransferase subunit alpha [Candidatus Hydrothermales bacterium]